MALDEFPEHVWDGLSTLLDYGAYPYDGRVPGSTGQASLREGPRAALRPDLADAFRAFVRSQVAWARRMGWHDEARQIERLAREVRVLQDGCMVFRDGTKFAFHDLRHAPGDQPMIAINFAGMSATRVDSTNLFKRYLGDPVSSWHQLNHVLRSATTDRPTSNTRLVELLGRFLLGRPETFLAYGHSMGGAFSQHLSNLMESIAANWPDLPRQRIASVGIQPASPQRSPHAPEPIPMQDGFRSSRWRSRDDPVGRVEGSGAGRALVAPHVEPFTGADITILDASPASSMQKHTRVYALLAEEVRRNPEELRTLLRQMQRAYGYSSRPVAAGPASGDGTVTHF